MADGFLDGTAAVQPAACAWGGCRSTEVRAVSLDSQVDELLRGREDVLAARAHAERAAIEGLKHSLAVARYRFRLLSRTLPAAQGPLPYGWEADVDAASGEVVYCATNGPRRWQHERPTAAALEEGQAAEGDDGRPLVGPMLEQLAAYQALGQGEVTRLVEVIETKSMEVGRMEIRLYGRAARREPGEPQDGARDQLPRHGAPRLHHAQRRCVWWGVRRACLCCLLCKTKSIELTD